MRILLIILLSLFLNSAYAKVYSIKLDNNKWIKEIPHVYTEADWRGTEWYCGATSYLGGWENDRRKNKKNLMGVNLSKENKEKHIYVFKRFLNTYIEGNIYAECSKAQAVSIDTWFDYENKIMGVFKALRHEKPMRHKKCMIYQSLIQKDVNVKTRVSMACYNSYSKNWYYNFREIPMYFKIDLDSFKRLNK